MDAIPTRVTIGKRHYWIHQKPRKKGLHGRIYFGTRAIVIHNNPDKAVDRNTFWHEITHAILFEMGTSQFRDERFVTEFADKLSGAIDSAIFK
jgi:hypothetical protein